MYYNDTETDTTGYKLITKAIGVDDYDVSGNTFINHPQELHIHVRFTRLVVDQNGKNTLLTFTLEGVMTS